MNNPAIWNYILDQLPVNSLIAGGAVRDFYFGLDPKDIDVFIPVGIDFPVLPAAFTYVAPPQDNAVRLLEYNNQAIQTVMDYNMQWSEDVTVRVQFIEVNIEPAVFTELTFDLSTSKAVYNRSLGLHYGHEFMGSVVTKEVTMLLPNRTELQLLKSRFRADKFIEKIGDGWTRRGF